MSDLLTADTSVVVPALSTWHEAHRSAAQACRDLTALPAHVLLETISVMTRLPNGLAVPVGEVQQALATNFPDKPLVLRAADYIHLTELIANVGAAGGQVYDAQVGFTASKAGAQLLTRDRRAAATYRAVSVSYKTIEG